MTVNEALRVVRQRWHLVLICLLLGLFGAATAVTLTPRQYTADVTLYVSLQGRAESSDAAYQASELAKQRVVSYAPLMSDDRITQAVVDKLKLPMTAAQLGKHLAVTAEPDTVVLTATVTDTSPQQAAIIADAVATEFVGLVGELEQPIGPAPPAAPAGQPPAQQARIGAQIIRPAIASPVPVSPNVPFGLALGAALGLLVGIGAAFLRNARDTAVRDPAWLQALTSVAVLTEVPTARDARTCPIALEQSPRSARAEAYRRLRTNLQFHGREGERAEVPKLVVVTSAVLNEGTSGTACNLARALADGGSRVLLIDANLRRPQVEAYYDFLPGPGLTTVLSGLLRWRFALRRIHDTPLEILPSGPMAERPAELLASHRMTALLHEVRQNYEFVIVDVPALLPVSDAAAVAARADGVVLVVRYGKTAEAEVAAAVDALESVSAPLLGTVLNMTPPRRRQVRGYPARSAPLLRTSKIRGVPEQRPAGPPPRPAEVVPAERPADGRPVTPAPETAAIPNQQAPAPDRRPSPVPRGSSMS